MAKDMWRLWFTKLLLLAALLLLTTVSGARSEGGDLSNDNVRAARIERNPQGITTVLLVSARPGKSVPPLGVLTKTARTFVQDGASTEFATQVLGTTLDNGRLYARILSTSSRVFYDKEPSPDPVSPYVVYPSRAPEDEWQLRVALDSGPIDAIKEIDVSNDDGDENESLQRNPEKRGNASAKLDELSRENDIFSKRELSSDSQRFKPAKVRPADNLPTYTVKQEYVSSHLDNFDEDQPKSFRPRTPKIFKPQPKTPLQKKADSKALPTVTYHGFADFTTTVGDTVIVFSPSTAPPPPGRPATTIKGDATLRPDDGVAVVKIKPTSVVVGHKKTETPDAGVNRDTDELLVAINGGHIQPSITEEHEVDSTTRSTDPLLLLPDIETGSVKPTGLLKVVDSTTSSDGTTTHYKSLIYGTYLGTNYAQIIHTSSNVYFFPDEATVTYGTEDTTANYPTTEAETYGPEQDTTLQMTTGTTPETPSDMNELTTPFRDTTDSVLTTLKDILESARKVLGTTESALPTIDDEIPNDIVTGDPQGRSIKGGFGRNDVNNDDHKVIESTPQIPEEKATLATRLLPSTAYTTFTYFTTFFIPDENDQTTTSVRSREVVSSEVSYLTELVLPSTTDSFVAATASVTPSGQTTPNLISGPEEEQTTKQDEEIELIFKTLYTTYTYLTTFFQEDTSSVSSREVIKTNVITQTVGPNGVSAAVAGLFESNESVLISPTKISNDALPSVTPGQVEEDQNEGTEGNLHVTLDETTDETLTTVQDRGTTFNDQFPTTIDDGEGETTNDSITDLEPSPTPAMSTEPALKEQVKTYYTTYTYFTTIFVDDETEIETRTEVFTNIVTETITPTAVLPAVQETSKPTTPANKPPVPPEILAYLEALQRQKSQEEALLLAKKVQEQANSVEQTESVNESTITTEGITDVTTEFPTTLERGSSAGEIFRDFDVNAQVTPNPPLDGEVLGSMITDVVSSSSSGGGTVLDIMDKRNAVPEDQELSETNHHDVEPAPTLLLQTSYTTFTYFTTMYKGDESTVNSRLETVTNIVTETIRPSAVLPAQTSTLPVTFFTTFTYWTTFYKGGDTLTTSREETVSNVVTPGVSPTPTVELGVIMTYRPTETPLAGEATSSSDKESKVTADNEVTPSNVAVAKKPASDGTGDTESSVITDSPGDQATAEISTISPEPTTFYTTFTYFTTSYIGNQTILNSRLETVTSVSKPDVTAVLATGRAIGGPIYTGQSLNTDDKTTTTSKVVEPPKTGLISMIRSSSVYDGTTTHYSTDVYGTYIDNLYAQVVESSTRLETPTLSSSSSIATPVLPTGVLSLNKGSVVDADEVTTVYFTTKQIGTLFDGLYAKVIESTSSTKIDDEKKATILPAHGHRTGLVRLIQGQIENNGTTTYYQSKVIGTNIDGRYAQIIESTSSFLSSTPTLSVAPSSTLPPSQSTAIPEISPSPAVIQSSLSEDPTTEPNDQEEDSEQNEEDDEEGEEDDDGQSSKKKSRLTFSTRKRTFTPLIRPFISRNRPTFNPKRKGAQGATTITRSDITPTITATLAGKGNRFSSSRGRITSPIGPYSSTLSPSSSRRFAGRRITPTSSSSYNFAASTRGRPQSRASTSSVFQGSRRNPSSIRGSSTRAATRGSSSIYPGATSRYRAGVKPSSTLLRGQSTARHDDQENDANEFTTTTLVTDETPYTDFTDGGETVTTPLQTTTESSRRSTNPLLRFRRPLNLNSSSRSSTTPRPASSTTSRRNGNLNRPSAPTIPNRANGSRFVNRGTAPISTRPRQSSTGLFPPRGLFGRKPEAPLNEPEEAEDEDENFEDEPVEEIEDNDYEGSEHEDRASPSNINRRSGKASGPAVQIRPFAGYGRARRVRRQASQLRSLTTRFRRPNQSGSSKADDKSDASDTSASKEESNKSVAKPVSRYSARGRTLTTSRPPSKSNNPEKSSAESGEIGVNQQNKARTRSKQSNGGRSTSSRIKPSPTSGSSRQFTLREKEGSSRSSYKRPNAAGARTTSRPMNKPTENGRVRPPRLRNGTPKTQTESSVNSRRVPPSRSSSRSSSRNGNGRRGSSVRGRGSHEEFRDTPLVHPDFDGTITVTHYVPTEVTIPVVNNGVTEQRNIITAQPSTEVLDPSQYSTVIGGNGKPLVVIVSEVTGTNIQGQTEITRFLLHETPTTRISHTLTTLGGRRASQSVIIPSTVYSVENIVSTIQPSLPGNSPLANILLSQLLLGQLGQQNPLLQQQGTPTTQFNTRTTSYVTTITKHQSTVIPLTFRGKEILTTLVDSSTDVVTATEFITDTVVVTPTAALPAANLNSLLLLLQQPQSQPQQSNPLLDPLFAAVPQLTQSNTLPGEVERRNQPADSDYKPDSYEYSDEEEEEEEEYEKPLKSRNTRGKSSEKKEQTTSSKAEYSVVTLYVSGRRPGEFTTVLSTVKATEEVSASRRRRDARDEAVEVRPSIPPSLHAGSEDVAILTGSEDPIETHAPTQSLESVVDEYDDGPFYDKHSIAASDQETFVGNTWSNSESKENYGRSSSDDTDEYPEDVPRKRVRIRVPVTRGRSGRQHKFTVIRRRPLLPYTRDSPLASTAHTPRRIVVTRVRTLGAVNSLNDADLSEPADSPSVTGRHKVTITRRRKIQPTSTETATLRRARITRKKLVAVRPVQPTPTFAIITADFFTASTSNYEDEYMEEKEDDEGSAKGEIHSTHTPDLEETPNAIDNKPVKAETEEEPTTEVQPQPTSETVANEPVIITDHFFFPPFSDVDVEKEYDDERDETTTTDEGNNEEDFATVSAINEAPTTDRAILITDDDDDSVANRNDTNVHSENSESTAATIPTLTEKSVTQQFTVDEADVIIAKEVSEMEMGTDHVLTTTEQSVDFTTQENDYDATQIDNTTLHDDVAETSLPPLKESSEYETSTVKDDTTETVETIHETTPTIISEDSTESVANIDNTELSALATDAPSVEDTTMHVKEENEQQPQDVQEFSTVKSVQETDDTLEHPLNEKDEKVGEIGEDTEQERDEEEALTVRPIQSHNEPVSRASISPKMLDINANPGSTASSDSVNNFDDSYIPSVIPLGADYTRGHVTSVGIKASNVDSTPSVPKVTTTIASPTPEDIEAGLADDLYLSLSRPDFPEILPSRPSSIETEGRSTIYPALVPSTSVYYTETVVTSTRLRTYTYVVTQLNGLETKVTSSTTVRPRVTTLTLTVPVTVTVTPTVESSASFVSSVYNPTAGENDAKDEEEGRRFNLATRVMSNGVEVIVAGPTPALRWENSNPQPTLTLSDTVVMLLPQDKPNEFVTKTCTTTFTYLSTITKDGTTTVSTEQQVVANTATEERHRKPGSETAAVTLETSPTLRTEVFKTTYTYLTLNTDHPNMHDALESSTKVIANTVTAPQHYLDMILEPSEAPRPETNTYLSTRVLEKTFMEDGRTRIETTSDTITQLIVTESAPPPKPTSVTTTLTALDRTEETVTDIMKTYYITYTYFNTFLEKGSTVVRTNVATSTDVVLEKVPVKKTSTETAIVNPTPEPIQIFATKTYLTTFTYFTTLLQAGPDGETSTTVSSRSHIVENVVTESIAPSLLDAGYINALLTTAHHSDPVKNVVTGSTIIFFDEEDQIDPSSTNSFPDATASMETQKDEKVSETLTSSETSDVSDPNKNSMEQDSSNTTGSATDSVENKRPSSSGELQVSNLLSLGSLGINSLTALGPVITAMAGLLQGKTTATRRNDTAPATETEEVTTPRSPIYIPVAEFADSDIEAAESQHIAAHLPNLNQNYIAETRHKVASSLADGIPISPGEVITANSDVIIGKPGNMAPRPPQTFLKGDEHIGMKPPPLPVPNIPVHPVLEVLEGHGEDLQPQQTVQTHKIEQVQILPAHQVYEEHLKIPVSLPLDTNLQVVPKQPQKLHAVQNIPPKKIGSKHDILENDPLLKPPYRSNVELYVNPNSHLKVPQWDSEKLRRPWSAKDPLTPPLPPLRFEEVHPTKQSDKNWPTITPTEVQKSPLWAQKDPLILETSGDIQTSDSKHTVSEPIVHQVPHVIDRSTGQPLLVNIQPSQVANIVIPQGGTQALIFGDTSEPHISGQYFDDPSPYPEPEVGPGFVGIQRVEDLPQYSNGNNPADYMVPPSPPISIKPLNQKASSSSRPHTIPLLPVRFDYARPQDKLEAPVIRQDKRPSDVYLIKRPEGSDISSGQGHVHTEILVHHRPETVNIRPQHASQSAGHSHIQSAHQVPQRGQFSKVPKPSESGVPPRRTEVSNPTEIPHRYIFLGKPDSGNEITLNSNWKADKKPPRITLSNRPRPRPPLRITTNRPLDRPVYVERPNSNTLRKPTYTGLQRLPPKTQNVFLPPHRTPLNPQSLHVPVRKRPEVAPDGVNEHPAYYGHHSEVHPEDRPYFHVDKTHMSNSGSDTQTERNEEHIPTGAIEYHNPSDPKEKSQHTGYHQDVSTTAPQIQLNFEHKSPDETSDMWHTTSQTEKLSDSDIGASEHVNFQNQYQTHKTDEDFEMVDVTNQKEQEKGESTVSEPPQVNMTTRVKDKYGTVGSVNAIVGKPLEIEQGITYGQKEKKPIAHNQATLAGNKDVIPTQEVAFSTDYYTVRPYEMPVIQEKPFGVYSDHLDLAVAHGYKRKDGKSDHEANIDSKKTSGVYKMSHDGQRPTQNTHNGDDTTDLKPPSIIPHFGSQNDRPGRPFSRPQNIGRPERPVLHSRPEIIITSPNKFNTRPNNYPLKRPGDNHVASLGSFQNLTLNEGIRLNQNNAVPGSSNEHRVGTHGSQQNVSTLHQMHGYKDETKEGNSENDTIVRPSSGGSFVQTNIGVIKPATRVHPGYLHILTKPKPQVPGPITISSGTMKPELQNRPNIRFSMPVEAVGEESDSKTQTERPPSMLVTKNNSDNYKQNEETLETAYQTNFALPDVPDRHLDAYNIKTKLRPVDIPIRDVGVKMEGPDVPATDIRPPPLRLAEMESEKKKNNGQEVLKPPPLPSTNVVGLSPPPVDITTTNRPKDDRFMLSITNESGLKPPPKYIPLKDSVGTITPPPLSVSMVPPSPKPSVSRPFLVELLSQDMVPPPPVDKTTRPLEIATVRPAVAVSGSIQIATAVATSHIPVIHDIESKIPIIHGTVDLPVIVDVPDILRPIETRMTEHVSVYTVRPFDTRPVSRVSTQPPSILTTNLEMRTIIKPLTVDHIQPSRTSPTNQDVVPTKSHTFEIPRNPVKRPEHPIHLESSYEYVLPSTRLEPTESLNSIVSTEQKKEQKTVLTKERVSKTQKLDTTEYSTKNETRNKEMPIIVTRTDSSITKVTSDLIPNDNLYPIQNRSVIEATKRISETVKPEIVKNGSYGTQGTTPKEATRFKTSTVTRVETSVLGSPPTTRTLLLTHTMTSTTVETVTETLLQPSVVATVTSTILQSIITRIPPTYENVDNDSIFVVMSDKKPPAPGAEEVEAEYGEEEISRDEQDPTGNEIHRVLAGGVLGAPVVPLQPPINQCVPECKASKSEICAEVGNEMRCICRPGFARMFPDRPCKPTYTYTVRVGLDRIGHEFIKYDAALNDSTSPTYRMISTPIKDALDRTMMQSDLRDIYRGLKIAGFAPDPTKVEFHVQLSDNANETRLKEVLQKYLVGNNYSLGGTEVYASKDLETIEATDFDECAAGEGGPHHDCSPNAACFNLHGSYQCSCKEGWADLSENPIYPGRMCSQAPLGCAGCNNKGHCITNIHGQEVCECFPWHSGQRCQVNLKVLLIALVTTGAILLGLLAVCVGLACFRHPTRRRNTGDRRAMIPGTGGDTSSEGSVTDLAIPHHVPHILPPPPQMIAPLPPTKKSARKISGKSHHSSRKTTMIPATVPVNDEQRDRSLTVMIPRAKYRSVPQSPQNFKSTMSTFSADEHKLINYLESGTHNPGNRKQSVSSAKECKETELHPVRTPVAPTGALVSAGFQVSATVTRAADADSTLTRSCGETTVEAATKVLRTGDLQGDMGSTLARSCGETTIQASTKLLRVDLGEAGSTLARSCGETTIQPPTKVAATRRSSVKESRDIRDARDSASEGHTMAERDLGSTLRLPAQHPPLYSSDRTSDRESNFDSL